MATRVVATNLEAVSRPLRVCVTNAGGERRDHTPSRAERRGMLRIAARIDELCSGLSTRSAQRLHCTSACQRDDVTAEDAMMRFIIFAAQMPNRSLRALHLVANLTLQCLLISGRRARSRHVQLSSRAMHGGVEGT